MRCIHRVYTALAFSVEERLLSIRNVYVFNQSRRVVFPKIPAFGYWEAWMCVSEGISGYMSKIYSNTNL